MKVVRIRDEYDEADLLFGPGEDGDNLPLAEMEFLFSMQSAGLGLEEKLQRQKAFRAADNDGKWAMLQELCPCKGDEPEIRKLLGL